MSMPVVRDRQFDVVVVASSLGGIEALRTVLEFLPPSFPIPLVAVQHLPAERPSRIHEVIGRRTRLRVVQPRPDERLLGGTVYVAPPGHNVRVWDGGRCLVTPDPGPEGGRRWRPSADLLFESAAQRFGARTLGIVLSGLLYDGAAGTARIRSAGGVVIAQDPATCVAAAMPCAALRNGADFALPPRRISDALVSLVTTPGVASLFGVGRFRLCA